MRNMFLFPLLFVVNTLSAQQINLVEYWFNNDFTEKTTLDITMNADDETDIIIPFPDNGTNELYETIYFRFSDSFGRWSPVVSTQMLNNNDSTIGLVQLEYWFDQNFSQKILIPVTAANNSYGILQIQEADVAWPDDAQIIYYRFKSKYNQWTAILSSDKDLMFNENDRILSMEYWFDDGFSNRGIVNIQTNETSEGILLMQQAEVSWQGSAANIHYRFLSKAGRWSPIISSNIDELIIVNIYSLQVKNSNMNVYPNPASNIINVENTDDLITSIALYNELGQQVLVKKSLNHSIELDISKLKTGIYILNVTTNNDRKDFKIVKR
jgi:hypothetical protein